jgi:hypothetical protein
MIDDDRDWIDFASNVGKERMERREALVRRLRWIGAALLVIVVAAVVWLAVRHL